MNLANSWFNRQKLAVGRLSRELAEVGSLRGLVFEGYGRMLKVRRGTAAFHPNGGQEILDLHAAVFTVRRMSPDKSEMVLCLQNVSNETVSINLPAGESVDLLERTAFTLNHTLEINSYQVLWLS